MTIELSPEVLAQYEALGSGCGYHRFAQRTMLELTGPDRLKFLHNFCTAEVKRLEPGQGTETFITNVQGKTIGYVTVLIRPESILLEGAAGQATGLMAHFGKYIVLDDAEIHDRSGELATLLVAGANCKGLLYDTIDDDLSAANDNVAKAIGANDVLITRSMLAGKNNYALLAPPDAIAGLEGEYQGGEAVPCTAEAVEMRRLEAGIPQFGSEVTDANLPQEIARDQQAISFTKGCYLGQETVARIDALGHVNRYLRVVKFSGEVLPDPGWEHAIDGKTVLKVTSSAYSPLVSAPISLAFMRRGHESIGTRLETDLGTAEVIQPPGA